MRAAEADRKARSRCWTEWKVPGAISVLVHLALVASSFALQVNWSGSPDLIKAEVLDIADSNSLKTNAGQSSQKQGLREISNQEMVERLSLPMGLPRNLKCSVAVTVAMDGQVLTATITNSTGNQSFDRSIVEAVYKASPFPKPSADLLDAGVYRFELRFGE